MVKIAVRCANLENINFTLHFDLFAHPNSWASNKLRIRRRPPFADRLSPECIAQLQQWISRCDDLHEPCRSGNEDFWPTRVIDVGPSGGSVDCKLILTSGRASKYVALSHCWGQPGPNIRTLRTVASTVDSHMKAIPLGSMPLNYQHAVSLTRALGFRYLWIDSICIHQDSAEDWAAQGSQMDKIYKCAWITLAATSASTSEDGFLQYALQDRMFTFQIPTNVAEHGPSNYREVHGRFMENMDSTRYEVDVEGATWNSRGWTLQERYLARRVIHFGRSQIFWECNRRNKSECGQRIIHLPFSITRRFEPADSSSKHSSESDILEDNTSEGYQTTQERSRLYLWWFQVVANYSRRRLTYPSDKLAAIAGLAKELNATYLDITQSEDQYLSGLWRGALADCLLWMPEDPDVMEAPELYRAPSWSWARWDGATIPCPRDSPEPDQGSSLVQYVSHDIELSSGNTFGGVSKASLMLRAGVTNVRIQGPWARDTKNWRYDMMLPDADRIVGIATLDGKDASTVESDTVFAMQVKAQKPNNGPARLLGYSGLLLRGTKEDLTFRRIGVFILDEEYLDILQCTQKSHIILI
ncbi:heterokaryon incompatibility protein-domain-containing protein [Phaeosphaeriaceae sp. PMI808]|nr:heterokaryon incompatibility protein-domain-containing protein [Phaeosphaeriaceae sp. PMI808]